MSKAIDALHVPRQYDRRVKLTDDDRAEIIRLRRDDPDTWSYGKLAKKHGVSRRLVIFTVKPETHERNLALRRERGGYVNSTEKHAQYMRSHRQYKRQLIEEGKL